MLTIVLISHDIKTAMQVSDMVHFIGRNRDSNNQLLPGASIHHNLGIDLKKRGLAWRNDVEKLKAISELETEVSKYFAYLSGNSNSYHA
jgi:ABC-type nitrate/sulfonate/bicarbonate transport system ATPase subunit